jgi:hypothetical protein
MSVPQQSVFRPPAPNACQSLYDQFYEAEPGVYAYWALCEKGSPVQIYDYVGQFDLTAASQSFGSGYIAGGASGPVPDGESAASVRTARAHIENQGLVLNGHAGTIATWVSADATNYPVTAVFLGAVGGAASVSVGVRAGQGICYFGDLTNSKGIASPITKCGYAANTWHRVVFTWSDRDLDLFIDGVRVAAGLRAGTLDNTVYFYRLFPGCCDTGKPMVLAKVSVSNQAWSQSQTMADFRPTIPNIPQGGVYVSSERLGTIHRDVLGYADRNQDISNPAVRAALLSGLREGRFKSLRYAGGYGGIEADLENWRGGVICTEARGVTAAPPNIATGNNIDSYLQSVARPLSLDVVYTVNYGTNPPYCTAGGSPTSNGADLVRYVNVNRRYKVRYWEIGNEVFSSNSETDFHPNPNTGASYVDFEPAFYSAMKAVDPAIEIGVPVGLATYSYQTGFDLQVLAEARYDAIVWHNYPVRDPISDGATLFQDRVASNLDRTRGTLLELQTELLNNGKAPDSIWVTEWNGEVYGDKWSRQTMGAAIPIFAVSQLAEYMQAGVRLATWWTQGRPNGCSTFNYDTSGDTAYSWWNCGSTALVYAGPTPGTGEIPVGLKAGDLTPAGHAFQILTESGFVTEGEHMLRTLSDMQNSPWLLSYAATHGSSYALVLINRDHDNPHTVPVVIAGKYSGGSVHGWTYGRTQYDASRVGDWSVGPATRTHAPWNGCLLVDLPPWSANVFVLSR